MFRTQHPHDDVTATAPPLATADGRARSPWHQPGRTRAQFLERLDALAREFDPVGLLQALLGGRLLEAPRRLRDCARRAPRVPEPLRLRAEAQADRLSWLALRELIAAQKRRGVTTTPGPEPGPEAEPEPEPEPPPIEPDPAPVDNRLDSPELDLTLSRSMPMVRGTRITAERVIGTIKAKWPVRVMLHRYPRLTPDAIRACRDSYAAGMIDPTNEDDWPGQIVGTLRTC